MRVNVSKAKRSNLYTAPDSHWWLLAPIRGIRASRVTIIGDPSGSYSWLDLGIGLLPFHECPRCAERRPQTPMLEDLKFPGFSRQLSLIREPRGSYWYRFEFYSVAHSAPLLSYVGSHLTKIYCQHNTAYKIKVQRCIRSLQVAAMFNSLLSVDTDLLFVGLGLVQIDKEEGPASIRSKKRPYHW